MPSGRRFVEVDEICALAQPFADPEVHRGHDAAGAGAAIVCSIFIASSTTSGAPFATRSPGLHQHRDDRARHRRRQVAGMLLRSPACASGIDDAQPAARSRRNTTRSSPSRDDARHDPRVAGLDHEMPPARAAATSTARCARRSTIRIAPPSPRMHDVAVLRVAVGEAQRDAPRAPVSTTSRRCVPRRVRVRRSSHAVVAVRDAKRLRPPRAPAATRPAPARRREAGTARRDACRSARCRGGRRRTRRAQRTRSRKPAFVVTPATSHSRAPRAVAGARRVAILAPRDHLGEHRVVVRAHLVAGAKAAVDALRRARAGMRQCGDACRSTAGTRGPGPRRRAAPRSRGRAARSASCASGSGSPAATRSCHSTRSRPVTISVTGCSTCSRVFISMKKKRAVLLGDELDRARADVADGLRRGDRGLAHRAASLGRHARAPAPPRAPSGGGAAPSSRARTDARRCRACRRTPGSRCGAGASRYFSISTRSSPKARLRLALRRGERRQRTRSPRARSACPCRRRRRSP